MKKVFIALGIYLFFLIGGTLIFFSLKIVVFGTNTCIPYENSFLSTWFDINYFAKIDYHKACIKSAESLAQFSNYEERDFMCKKIVLTVDECIIPIKPILIYFILGISILLFGIRLRKKYILQ